MLNGQFVAFVKLKGTAMWTFMQLQSSLLDPLSLSVLKKTIYQ